MSTDRYRSKCCGAPVEMVSGVPDFIGSSNRDENVTCWAVCSACRKDCDVVRDREGPDEATTAFDEHQHSGEAGRA